LIATWEILVLVGMAGIGIGLGLILGAFHIRILRRYIRNGNGDRDDKS
jgi:hypothetical protein